MLGFTVTTILYSLPACIALGQPAFLFKKMMLPALEYLKPCHVAASFSAKFLAFGYTASRFSFWWLRTLTR
jgi:hypothetical protein